jgi:hypothetical protein
VWCGVLCPLRTTVCTPARHAAVGNLGRGAMHAEGRVDASQLVIREMRRKHAKAPADMSWASPSGKHMVAARRWIRGRESYARSSMDHGGERGLHKPYSKRACFALALCIVKVMYSADYSFNRVFGKGRPSARTPDAQLRRGEARMGTGKGMDVGSPVWMIGRALVGRTFWAGTSRHVLFFSASPGTCHSRASLPADVDSRGDGDREDTLLRVFRPSCTRPSCCSSPVRNSRGDHEPAPPHNRYVPHRPG